MELGLRTGSDSNGCSEYCREVNYSYLNLLNPTIDLRTKDAYKCEVFTSWSNPSPSLAEVGRVPFSWLSARSNQLSLDSLPREAGIRPMNWFEFKDLKEKLKT